MLRGGRYNSPPSCDASDCESIAIIDTTRKHCQLNYIKKLISLTRAFSIHYYRRAKFWKMAYWGLSAFSVGLTGLNTIINAFFDRCSTDPTANNVNVTIGAMILAVLSGITVLNAPLRQKTNEEAGDKYNATSNNLYVDVFCADVPPNEHDLKAVIDKYVMYLNELSDRYEEPSLNRINSILGSDDYSFLVRIHQTEMDV